jgi:hypothetical protein
VSQSESVAIEDYGQSGDEHQGQDCHKLGLRRR